MHIEVAPRRRRSVSLTPLIDVVFNLLLFFMLASSLTDWRSLALATGSEVAADDTPPAAEILVRPDGRYLLAGGAGEPLSLEALAEHLRASLAEERISSAILRPGDGVTLGTVAATFDELGHRGITALALGESGSGE